MGIGFVARPDWQYDMAILDVMLPKLDGWSIVRKRFRRFRRQFKC
jgi:DNA-binding response OmpR family regulator